MTITTEGLLLRAFRVPTATAVQRAGARAADGLPLGDLRDHPDVIAAFGGAEAIAALPSERGVKPLEFFNVASPRTAKTTLACAAAIVATQTVDLNGLGPGEIPRVSILSLKLDVADVPFTRLLGAVEASPTLKKLLHSKTADSLLIKHPTGRLVEVAVVAGGKAAGGLVARWSAGLLADEATRMHGAADGAIANLDEALSAIRERLLPGAQIQGVGSPHAPFGPMYDLVQQYFGKPTESTVVMRTTGPAGNPSYWTPERLERLRERDEAAWRIVALGEFLDPEASLLNPIAIKRNTRETPLELPPRQGLRYSAATDPSEGSASGNAWTLVIIEDYDRIDEQRPQDPPLVCFRVALAKEFRGMGPEATLKAIASDCARYGLRKARTDQYAAGANIALARRFGLELYKDSTSGPSKLEDFTNLATLLHSDRVELPPDRVLRRDLLGIKKRVTQTGQSIVLPKTNDGRHCDFAPALAAALKQTGRIRRRTSMLAALQEMTRRDETERVYGALGLAVPE